MSFFVWIFAPSIVGKEESKGVVEFGVVEFLQGSALTISTCNVFTMARKLFMYSDILL